MDVGDILPAYSRSDRVELNTTRNFLLTQQTAEVNNTINSMGLALAPYLEQDDKVATESVINALFDGGFYQEVRLKMLSDGSEIVREYPITVEGVPDWYTSLDLFPVITEERTFTSGWLQLAEVKVVSHPVMPTRKCGDPPCNWGFGLASCLSPPC